MAPPRATMAIELGSPTTPLAPLSPRPGDSHFSPVPRTPRVAETPLRRGVATPRVFLSPVPEHAVDNDFGSDARARREFFQNVKIAKPPRVDRSRRGARGSVAATPRRGRRPSVGSRRRAVQDASDGVAATRRRRVVRGAPGGCGDAAVAARSSSIGQIAATPRRRPRASVRPDGYGSPRRGRRARERPGRVGRGTPRRRNDRDERRTGGARGRDVARLARRVRVAAAARRVAGERLPARRAGRADAAARRRRGGRGRG